MATFTVTTAADVVNSGDGVLSLREAVAQTNATTAADKIVFFADLEGKTLTLTGGAMALTEDVTIVGDRDGNGIGVSIDGNRQSAAYGLHTGGHMFDVVERSTAVSLHGLTLTNGYGHDTASAILVDGGSLTISNCTLSNNRSGFYDDSGAIYVVSDSKIAVQDSRIVGGDVGISTGVYGKANLRISNSELSGLGGYHDGAVSVVGDVFLESSALMGNSARYGSGGALSVHGDLTIVSSAVSGNTAYNFGGGIFSYKGKVSLIDSTLQGNSGGDFYGGGGGGIEAINSRVIIRNSTVTNNVAVAANEYGGRGGGIAMRGDLSTLDIANSIVAGNIIRAFGDGPTAGPDISGTVAFSNGHNVFGSDVAGNVSGDRENIAASAIFAAIDPATGGGQVNAAGIVPLKNALTNPALSGADPLAASDTGQLGGTGRPLPAGSLPDIGSIEINQALSTTASANNDVLSGTGSANTVNGLAGADYLKGLAGNDTLRGGDGGDLLDGGTGNDKLYGDAGIDLVFYGGSTKVVVDLSLATDKATRGSETDTLYNVEGAIGSSAADVFKGNEYNNLFQGGLGKDTASGGSGRDLYDFNAIADSKAGAATRDVITDFAHLADKIDLMGLDADTAVAGNQAFRWVGNTALTGPGEVGFTTSGGNTIIRASNDADATSEFEIQLTGIKTLTAVDFYL